MNEYKRVLVTGGCGFIGSNFINYLKIKIPEIFIVNIDKIDYCSNNEGIKYDLLYLGASVVLPSVLILMLFTSSL